MLIGAMNHPRREVLEEIRWMAEMGLQFLDLTLEPPAATVERVDAAAIRRELERHRMPAVGHTAFYMPLTSPYESIRRAAVQELRRCIDVFAEMGVTLMNVHPAPPPPMHDRAAGIRLNLQSLAELLPHAQRAGIVLMLENIPGYFNSVRELAQLLDPMPELALHLDIGHCNLRTTHNTAESIIDAYADRIAHVHLHDNRGGHADLHLPLGTGNIDMPACVGALRRTGYDGPITLEVFAHDRSYLAYSRDVLRQLWDDNTHQPPPPPPGDKP